jgi:ASC-1-like (ASCH) protein
MINKMKLNPEPFDRVRSGEKTLEIRLNDLKRQQIKVGDTIEFTKRPDLIEKIDVEVLALSTYKSFEELVANSPMTDFGYPEDYDKSEFVKLMYDIYDKVDEEKWGVLGIKIKKRLI